MIPRIQTSVNVMFFNRKYLFQYFQLCPSHILLHAVTKYIATKLLYGTEAINLSLNIIFDKFMLRTKNNDVHKNHPT